jgi:hypothetical protein
MNGKGGCGKDTICGVLANRFRARNDSSVDPIREVSRMLGWDGKTKDDKWRKFMSDVKRASIEYNDYPTTYIVSKVREFMNSDDEIFFTHIREPAEIAKFAARAAELAGGRADVRTLLVRRKSVDSREFGNVSDDMVDRYLYDWVYDNDGALENIDSDFMKRFDAWRKADGIVKEGAARNRKTMPARVR